MKSFVFFGVLLVTVSVARADNSQSFPSRSGLTRGGRSPTQVADCDIQVRVLRGSDRQGEFQAKRLQTGAFLQDVKNQLQPLPFSKYHVLNSATKVANFREQVVFPVVGSEGEQSQLHVTPWQVVHNRVQVLVDWKGEPDSEELLSTTLRIPNGQSMVVGTDAGVNRSTILCIKVGCR